jgi:hypothetical protein
VVEWDGLENRCMVYSVPWVRIPPSPSLLQGYDKIRALYSESPLVKTVFFIIQALPQLNPYLTILVMSRPHQARIQHLTY